MNALELANRLIALCREGKNMQAIDELYAPNVVSVEAADVPGMGRVTEGIEGVRGKTNWWFDNHEIHAGEVDGPYLHGDDKFIVHFKMDVTPRQTGERTEMDEVGVYTVKDGKVVREEFYYYAPAMP